jgi:hypothetical protein
MAGRQFLSRGRGNLLAWSFNDGEIQLKGAALARSALNFDQAIMLADNPMNRS